MTANHDSLPDIALALARHGAEALAAADGETTEVAARRWLAAGFDDAGEVADWLAARCFRPEVAARLEAAGVTPEQAELMTAAGRRDYEDTIAYKLSRGDLTIEEVRRIVTNDFWNS